MGMISISLLLLLTLEVDMANVAICWGNFYYGLLGCDLLCRYNEALCMATITLPGLQ